MVKGCERRVVYLKNTDSELFEEAFFVMKDAKTAKPPSREAMVREANRILDKNMTVERDFEESVSLSLSVRQACISFLFGTVFASGIFILFSCLI